MQASKKGSFENHKNQWIKGIFLVVLWLLVLSMVRDFWSTKKGFSRIDETERKLVDTRLKNEELLAKLQLVSTNEYKNRLIREKLNMQRGEEVVVIMPKTKTSSIGLESEKKELSNWQKWLEALGLNPNSQ